MNEILHSLTEKAGARIDIPPAKVLNFKGMICDGIDAKHPGSAGYKKMLRRFCGRGGDRFWELDFVRGLCVMLMIFDHLMFSLWAVLPSINRLFGTSVFAGAELLGRAYWTWYVRNFVWQFAVCSFFLLCGISCTLSRGNFRRFIPLGLAACGITAVTSLAEQFGLQGVTVLFGALHMISAGVLLYAFLDNAAEAAGDCLGQSRPARIAREALRYLPGVAGVALLVFLFTACGDLVFKDGLFEFVSSMPSSGELSDDLFLSLFVEVREFNFSLYSSDYFPLLPYAAILLCGGILGRLIYHTPARYAFAPFDGAWNSGPCFLGRHAAVIYLSHMVVIPCFFAVCAGAASLF